MPLIYGWRVCQQPQVHCTSSWRKAAVVALLGRNGAGTDREVHIGRRKKRRGMAPSSAVFSHYHQSVDFSSLAIRAGLAQPPRHASLLGSYFIELPSRQRCALHHPPRTASVLYHLEKTGPKPNKGFTGHACIPSASVVF